MHKLIGLTLLLFFTQTTNAQESSYKEHLKIACEKFLLSQNLDDNLLLKLVPSNQAEFSLLYETTSSENKKLSEEFFYQVTQAIFDKFIKEKKEQFYMPSIELSSYADGEYGEGFVDNLSTIVKLDRGKFCEAIKNRKISTTNPIKYFADENKCDTK